ncbi:MAG: GAF domain-containing protein [Isosphaeraceae bacterium]|nr:GAF domain-containing protein [Isosphaeraceae bacterium]
MTIQAQRVPSLRLLGGSAPAALRTFDLSREVTVLGRDPGCHIILIPPSVSRRHARVLRRGDGYYLEDLGSAGGTMLNGGPLATAARLRNGDRIGIGDCTFAFSDPPPPVKYPSDDLSSILGVRDVSDTAERALAGVFPELKLRAILEISRDLTGAHELPGVLERALDALFRIFPQAERGFVLLKKEGNGPPPPRAVKVRGGAGRVAVSKTVLEHVVRNGQAILSEDATSDSRFQGSRSVDDAEIRTLMCAPLKDHQRKTVGIIQLDTRESLARFTQEDLDVLAAVAGQIGVAIDNARLLDAATRERQRLALLAEAGATLASPLDLPATLTSLARLVVPQLADLCLIDLVEDDGSIRRVAAAHADAADRASVEEQLRRFPPDPHGTHPVVRVLQSGKTALSNVAAEPVLAEPTRGAEPFAAMRQLRFTSYLIVPLTARERTLGTIALLGTDANRSYGPADQELAEELARRAAQAVDNAALYHAAQAARRQAEDASRAKDLFLAMLSHELRTPLTPILAAVSDRLSRDVDPELQPELEMIRRNVALEARLIDDLLDLSRIERGRLRLEREVVDLHRTIQQALEICRDEISIAGLEVHQDLAAQWHHVEGDHARLMQIAWNLMRNAAKFTPAGGTLTIRTSNPRVEASGLSEVIVEVVDTGRGIEPELLGRIFDAFEQGQSDGLSRGGGLGLGLAISRSLAEAHGGRLTAHSEGRGLGATFRLQLHTVTAPVDDFPPDRPAPTVPSHPQRILLVEDNRDTLRYLSLILGAHGHTVRAAACLADARAEAASGEFDVLVSDVELPDGTGLELMRELAEHGIPGVAMSGYGSEEDVRFSLDAGFTAHLTKPVDAATLEETIQRVARSRA